MKGELVRVVVGVLASAMVVGCNNGSSGSNEPALVGTWLTEQCVETSLDVGGSPTTMWAKGEYTFSEEGLITSRVALYADSACTTAPSLVAATDAATTRVFEDMGTELLSDGSTGHRIHIQRKDGDVVVLDQQDVFAVILDDIRLCTSENLQFTANSMNYSEVAGTQINYEACLASGSLP